MSAEASLVAKKARARVSRLAEIADRCRYDNWEMDTDDGGIKIVALRAAGERAALCTIHAEALPDEIELISGALSDAVLFLELRRKAIIAFRSAQGTRPVPQRQDRLSGGDFAANAAILCAEPLFHRFLERRDPTRAIYNKDHADTVLKKLIGITSKKQLNTEGRAQTAFLDLRADYQAWKERGRA